MICSLHLLTQDKSAEKRGSDTKERERKGENRGGSSCSSLPLGGGGGELTGQVLKRDRTSVGYLTSPYVVNLRKCTIR